MNIWKETQDKERRHLQERCRDIWGKKLKQLHVLCIRNHIDKYSMWKIMLLQMAMTLINNLISGKCSFSFYLKGKKIPSGQNILLRNLANFVVKAFFQEISVSFMHWIYYSHEKGNPSNSSPQAIFSKIYSPFFSTSHFCKNWKPL